VIPNKPIGGLVNLEADIAGKHIVRLLDLRAGSSTRSSDVDGGRSGSIAIAVVAGAVAGAVVSGLLWRFALSPPIARPS